MLIIGLLVLVGLWYAICNILVVFMYTPKAMYREMWVEQSIFGKIAANVFYAPAWLIQCLYVGLFIGFYWLVKGIALGTLWVVHRIHNGNAKALRGEF